MCEEFIGRLPDGPVVPLSTILKCSSQLRLEDLDSLSTLPYKNLGIYTTPAYRNPSLLPCVEEKQGAGLASFSRTLIVSSRARGVDHSSG